MGSCARLPVGGAEGTAEGTGNGSLEGLRGAAATAAASEDMGLWASGVAVAVPAGVLMAVISTGAGIGV